MNFIVCYKIKMKVGCNISIVLSLNEIYMYVLSSKKNETRMDKHTLNYSLIYNTVLLLISLSQASYMYQSVIYNFLSSWWLIHWGNMKVDISNMHFEQIRTQHTASLCDFTRNQRHFQLHAYHLWSLSHELHLHMKVV